MYDTIPSFREPMLEPADEIFMPPIAGARVSKKFLRFKEALEMLCIKHQVTLYVAEHGALQLLNLECQEVPVVSNGFDDRTTE